MLLDQCWIYVVSGQLQIRWCRHHRIAASTTSLSSCNDALVSGGRGVTAVVSLLRCHCRGVTATVSLPRCHCHGVTAMVSPQWCDCHGVTAVVSPPWCHRSGVAAMVSPQWCRGSWHYRCDVVRLHRRSCQLLCCDMLYRSVTWCDLRYVTGGMVPCMVQGYVSMLTALLAL